MPEDQPFNLRWGILATGGIAKTFATDLLIDPSTRSVTDVSHTITAAASSTSASRARQFLSSLPFPSSPTTQPAAYGDYASLASDPNVDIIYIATPHSHHFANALCCLRSGKHVLIEKPITVNAAQARVLISEARKRNLFLMEAVWTRFFPLVRQISALVRNHHVLGDPSAVRVFADFCGGFPDMKGTFEDGTAIEGVEGGNTHRMVNMSLAGGALLDLGVYPLHWAFELLYNRDSSDKSSAAPKIASSMTPYTPTGCDETTTILLTFPPANTHAIATTSIRLSDNPDCRSSAGAPIRIQGPRGEIQVLPNACRPVRYRVIPSAAIAEAEAEPQQQEEEDGGKGEGVETPLETETADPASPTELPLSDVKSSQQEGSSSSSSSKEIWQGPLRAQDVEVPIPGVAGGEDGAAGGGGKGGHGMFYQADECARRIRDGETQSQVMSWAESLAVMECCDEVRRQGRLRYPDAVESAEP